MLSFQINNQDFEQTTSKIIGEDVIQAVVDFIQQQVIQNPEMINSLNQFLTIIFQQQPGTHPVLYSNQVQSQMERIYDLFIKDLDSNRPFTHSHVIHSYHKYISELFDMDYEKTRDNLRQMLAGFTREEFIAACLEKSFRFGFAKNRVPTEYNELLLMLVQICDRLEIECIIKLIYASEEDNEPQDVYGALFSLSPFMESGNYVNPLRRTAKKSSALLFLMHFWSDQYSAYATDHQFKDNVSVEIEEFTYAINRNLSRQDVEPQFRDIFTHTLETDVVDLSIPMKALFGTCTSGSYKIVISTRFQNKESIESIHTEDDPVIKLHPEYGHDDAIAGCEQNKESIESIHTEDDPVIKLHPEYGHDDAIAGCEYNTLVFSNPNSGKTFGFKQRLSNRLFELAYQNPRSVTEWKKSVLIQHISRDYYVGTLLKAIATASLNPDQHFYILADEVGTFNLDWILGANLKKIFKKSQRIDFSEQPLYDRVSFLDPHELTLTAFKELGDFIAEQADYATKTTQFSEGEHEFVLWLPHNLHVVFLANYEEELLSSLSELKGWGPNGNRFDIVHYYALEQETSGFFSFQPNDLEPEQMEKYQSIRRWNSKIYDELRRLLTNRNELSRSERKEIGAEMVIPRLLISTFDPNVPNPEDLNEYILAKLDDFTLLSVPLMQKIEEAISNINFNR